MQKYFAILVAIALVLCMVFAGCAPIGEQVAPNESTIDASVGQSPSDDLVNEVLGETYTSSSTLRDTTIPTGEYNKGVVLVKYDGAFSNRLLGDLDVKSVEQLFKGSKWHTILLEDGVDTEEAVKYLHKLDVFETVDYDYVMKSDGEVQSIDISGNSYDPDPGHLETLGIHDAWGYCGGNNHTPGGISDVVVAVIDTGVDYNHLDLRNNIWVNSAEIPGNGIDDDGNGYVDDINGWDCVGNDNDPMDDNGHGTHVAGIVAAENNNIGTVGVAFNCKVMVLKAGNSSGHFNNSDIAEAIQYAYMNGASVINMSFGGSSISIAVEDALMDAYNQCVLVAAAGNESLCNNINCLVHERGVCYPAALSYVIGVMSCNNAGTERSSFSNFDHYPNNSVEYEVYAPGEAVPSTWPGSKYARLNGTSMAAPTVAGIAALLRSYYTDREVYSNKYIQSQIVNTGTQTPIIDSSTTGTHTVVDAYLAMTQVPTPNVKLYDAYIFDNVEFSDKNNGDGRIDAGETIRVGIELRNIGGVASNVVATLDTIRNGDPNLTDPYFDITTSQITLSDIGTYSIRDGGLIYEGGIVVGAKTYFEIVVSEDCPNDYLCTVNINLSYTNGMDESDTTTYTNASDSVELTVTNGVVLPLTITEDTIFPGNKRYIVSHNVTIAEGVAVTFEAGAVIQFYENSQGYYDTLYDSPKIVNYGTINFNGTKNKMIQISPSELFAGYLCFIENYNCINFTYTEAYNLSSINSTTLCTSARQSKMTFEGVKYYSAGNIIYYAGEAIFVNLYDCHLVARNKGMYAKRIVVDSAMNCLFDVAKLTIRNSVTNNFFIFSESLHIDGGATVYNNVFTQGKNSHIASEYGRLIINNGSFLGNKFYGMYNTHPDVLIENLIDDTGNCRLDVNDTTGQDLSLVWPYITNIHMEDSEGNTITTCGTDAVKFVVDFNRDMDTTKDTKIYFGSVEPYADYEIEGEWASARQWVGEYTLKTTIENGEQRFRLENAWSAADEENDVDSFECFNNGAMYTFTIDTTAAMAMNLQANPTDNGIELTFAQDDYDTLLGYNIYRSEEKDGNYVKLNPAILLPTDSTFLDENAEPGKTYWYTYTVVLTDFTESNPAGKVVATAKDTMAPSVYHTPVNQGYLNNNLVISCTASDNVAITSVVLYYRAVGATEWKTITMLKQNDKYSATIFGSELTLEGLEYYIVANDTMNSVSKGSAETPYTVVVKDASAISRKGDVDGDGVVTTKDALMIMQCINGDLIMTDDEFKRADLNEDGVLSSMEALRILQYINGNVTTLEM